MKGSDYAID